VNLRISVGIGDTASFRWAGGGRAHRPPLLDADLT
jgi:hypothetical protein